MLRSLILVLLLAGMGIAEAAPVKEYVFEPLPVEVEGIPLGTPIAIANDGAVLSGAGIYRNGQLDPIDLSQLAPLPYNFLALTDINSSHAITGYNWFFKRWPYNGYVGQGFILGRGVHSAWWSPPSISLRGINDRGVAVGTIVADCPIEVCGECPFEICTLPQVTTAALMKEGAVTPLTIPGVDPNASTFAIAIDDGGRILGGISNWQNTTYFLLDGARLTPLVPPEGLDEARFVDLNNRGQLLGWGRDPSSRLGRGFLREPDGADQAIEWTYPWAESLVVDAYTGEELVVRYVQSSTFSWGINDRGEILASSHARYEGRLANGHIYVHGEVIYGVGRSRADR